MFVVREQHGVTNYLEKCMDLQTTTFQEPKVSMGRQKPLVTSQRTDFPKLLHVCAQRGRAKLGQAEEVNGGVLGVFFGLLHHTNVPRFPFV